jgi:hypothetical protein
VTKWVERIYYCPASLIETVISSSAFSPASRLKPLVVMGVNMNVKKIYYFGVRRIII